ncbi:hypothetical protein PMAYCL1PPCAC_26489, partial [Pristionchus mayeri]
EDCSDLANLAQVSTHYFSNVTTFMNRAGNRPGVERVFLTTSENGLDVIYIQLIPANIFFYGLADLSRRFARRGNAESPLLMVEMNGSEVSIFEQV